MRGIQAERSEGVVRQGFAPIPNEPKANVNEPTASWDVTEDVPTSHAKERERLSVAGCLGTISATSCGWAWRPAKGRSDEVLVNPDVA